MRGRRPGDPADPGLTTRDRQGGDSTLTFTNLKENQGISDKEFAFRIPRGVDVITMANTQLAASRLLLLLAVILAGCATTGALRSGKNAELAQDYDRAVVEYTKALQQDPDNRDARQGLERAKLRAALEHFTRGRRLHDGGPAGRGAGRAAARRRAQPDGRRTSTSC